MKYSEKWLRESLKKKSIYVLIALHIHFTFNGDVINCGLSHG